MHFRYHHIFSTVLILLVWVAIPSTFSYKISSQQCSLCINVVDHFDSSIKDESLLIDSCSIHYDRELCQYFVQTYHNQFSSNSNNFCLSIGICQQDHLNNNNNNKNHNNDNINNNENIDKNDNFDCSICKYIVSGISGMVASNQSIPVILEVATQSCHRLSDKSWEQTCENIVDENGPQLIGYLRDKLNPEQACYKIHKCYSSSGSGSASSGSGSSGASNSQASGGSGSSGTSSSSSSASSASSGSWTGSISGSSSSSSGAYISIKHHN
ncbi:hypothetical protein DFA_00337 [Cavenderia fasciculata]|uniref:Saposin B-type domain-containing protein n=1 Tax=Cavenderia fasciculata TaxID=261658 RepID=F4PR65_CACFS|nr:uncharacterized protein DFA_00337 [Cavenderia fasciculata]EGG20476.1 hypothetical protein DFA_00337 [Cavenderia fasciculata]|eukprot:XP_004358326.1 hypothetical protein DFA_00337 [Cavenderia fasciculata]